MPEPPAVLDGPPWPRLAATADGVVFGSEPKALLANPLVPRKVRADGLREKRWVVYNGEVEASRVPAEWHGWLHHTWDQPPTKAPLKHKAWEKPHQENLTGTAAAYAPPGSIRRPDPVARRDYEAWQPE